MRKDKFASTVRLGRKFPVLFSDVCEVVLVHELFVCRVMSESRIDALSVAQCDPHGEIENT